MDEWDGVVEGTLYWIEVYVIGCMRGGGVGDTMYRKKLYDSIGCVGWSGVGVGMIYIGKVIFNLMYWYGMGEGWIRDNMY